MLKEIKGKVKEKAVEVKDWTVDHKGELIAFGSIAGILVGGIVLGRRVNKKYVDGWRRATEAYKNGDLTADFGPYKLMRFLEPKTGEFIGEVMCHEDTVKAFLDVK